MRPRTKHALRRGDSAISRRGFAAGRSWRASDATRATRPRESDASKTIRSTDVPDRSFSSAFRRRARRPLSGLSAARLLVLYERCIAVAQDWSGRERSVARANDALHERGTGSKVQTTDVERASKTTHVAEPQLRIPAARGASGDRGEGSARHRRKQKDPAACWVFSFVLVGVVGIEPTTFTV